MVALYCPVPQTPGWGGRWLQPSKSYTEAGIPGLPLSWRKSWGDFYPPHKGALWSILF